MAKAGDDPGTMEFDFGDDELNDPNYEQTVGNPDGGDEAQAADSVEAPNAGSTPAAGEDRGGDDDGSAAGDGSGAQSADAQGQRGRAGATTADKDGNLVDAQGNIVASAGAERRHYEQSRRQLREIQRLESELAAAKQQGDSVAALGGVPAQLGLNAQETSLGLNIVAQFKRDPVQTARWILQETMKLGHNLHQIVGTNGAGQLNSGSMDLQAVRDMINTAVQPLVGDRNAQQQQLQAEQAARREYNSFLAKHDHAAVHEDLLGHILQDHPDMAPEVAYWQLVAYAARNDLDFTQPLAPQVQARRGQGGGQPASNGNAQPSPAQGQRQQPMSMPNGGAPTADMRTGPELASPDDSWDSIVQTSLREAGFNR